MPPPAGFKTTARDEGVPMGFARAVSWFSRVYGLGSARSYGPMVWLLAGGTIVSYLGRGAAVPFVVVYLREHAGLALATIGLGVILEQATRALASPFFGNLSDRYGRKPFMIGGVILQALTFPAYLLVDGPAAFLAVSVLAGLGQAPYHPAISAFLAETTPAHRRVGVFGLVQMTKNLGWALGVLLGGLLVARSFALLFLVGGALPLIYAVFLALFLVDPTTRATNGPRALVPPWRTLLKQPRFAAFVGLATVVFLTWGQLNSVLPVFIGEGLLLDPVWITRAFAVNSLLIVLLQVPVSARAESWSRPRGLALAGGINAAGYVLLALALKLANSNAGAGKLALLAAVIVLTLAEMLDTPLTFAFATELAPPGARGGAMGVLALAAPLGMGAAPLLAGAATGAATWSHAWAAFAALALLGGGGFLLLGRASAPAADPKAEAPIAT